MLWSSQGKKPPRNPVCLHTQEGVSADRRGPPARPSTRTHALDVMTCWDHSSATYLLASTHLYCCLRSHQIPWPRSPTYADRWLRRWDCVGLGKHLPTGIYVSGLAPRRAVRKREIPRRRDFGAPPTIFVLANVPTTTVAPGASTSS